MPGYTVARLKRRTSVRGIVTLVFAAVVAGLSVATLRYHPAPPIEAPLSPAHVSSAAVPPPPPTIIAPPPTVKPVAGPPPTAHPSDPPKTKTP
ncbi:Serine/threonine protein kinase (fragment) [uncultured Mycobacterium sp.]|uniref:Serine/threonine protein kinase n=1 Tax=uncultured Mycobacterium sp. TaxID=171292 RepID=A0A1Y5PPX0_9MYCO